MQGEVLGVWRIGARLGVGAMGTVHRAVTTEPTEDLEAGAEVAVKVIHPHLLGRPKFVQRFLREGAMGRNVRHPNVVRTHACDVATIGAESRHYLVMEYVQGQTLRDLLDELGTAPERLCRHVGREIARGLEAIHATGVVHRDLKPENVLITPEQDVKIMDLGVARLRDEAIRLSQTGAFAGSIGYAAPEQFGGRAAMIDGRADLHALGSVLYELASGRPPFEGEHLREVLRRVLEDDPSRLGALQPQLSAFFEEVVHTLLAKSPDRRFLGAGALVQVLVEGEEATWWKKRSASLRRQTKSPTRRIRLSRATALYGRDEELAQLRAAFERARAGHGQVRLIRGEPGVGKTRLMDELVTRLRQDGVEVNFLFGAYPPGGASTGTGAFTTAYREHFGSAGLEDTLAEALRSTPALVPPFAALLRGETPHDGPGGLTTGTLHTAFIQATRVLARARPTVVLIDDLHFAPEMGPALFAALALSLATDRVLLVGTLPTTGLESWATAVLRSDHVDQIDLARLAEAHLRPLLVEAFRSRGLADELAGPVAESSQGNPFFLFEILDELKQGGRLVEGSDGRWVTNGEIRAIDVPTSVVDLVRARVATLSSDERNLLDIASCVGFEFDPALVATVNRLGRISTYKSLARIERAGGLVRSAGRRFTFDHHLVQETLYGALHPLLREEYHGALAEALQAGGDAHVGETEDIEGSAAVQLCEHLLRGGRAHRARELLAPALDHLERDYLNDRAVELADRALAVPDLLMGEERCRVLLRKAERLDLLGRREAQSEALGEAQRVARDLEDARLLGTVHVALAQCAGRRARYGEAETHARRAISLCDASGYRRGVDSARTVLGVAAMSSGRLEEARDLFDRLRREVRDAGDLDGEARMIGNLGAVLQRMGRYEEARGLQEQRLALACEAGDRQGEAVALGNLGVIYKSLGRYDAAREHHARTLDLARRIGDRQGQARAIGNLGNVCQALGELDEARDLYERQLAMAVEIGDPHGEARAHTNLGVVARDQGRFAAATSHQERALAVWREAGDRWGEARTSGSLGGSLVAQGRLAEAAACYRRQEELAEEMGDRWSRSRCEGSLGILALHLGRVEEAEERLTRALDLARTIGERRLEAAWLHALGELALERGDEPSARSLLEEALTLRSEMRHRLGEASTRLAMGVMERRGGDAEAGRRHLEEARELARQIESPGVLVLAEVHLALVRGSEPSAALDALKTWEHGLEHRPGMEVRYLLWRATGDPSHLAAAHRALETLRGEAPEADRDRMLRTVSLYRDIHRAAQGEGMER